MKVLLAVAAVAVAMAEEGCSCPKFIHSHENGMAFIPDTSAVDHGIPPCCEDIARQKAQIAAQGLVTDSTGNPSKHTPGSPCSSLNSCASCTTLAFCRWHEGLGGIDATRTGLNVCVDETAVPSKTANEYVASCASRAAQLYGLAEERDQKEWKDSPDWNMPQVMQDEKDAIFTKVPIIAPDESQWPHAYDDYLPPAGCDRVDKSLYPTGMPGCGDYVNEGTSYQSGHMTTDIVSDPRLPVETHVPHYPLGANSQLPDHIVEGGDWSLPQPNAPWIKPDFNKNGCLGGPCDEASQHACTGLTCSHLVVHGEKHHDAVKGSVYERENGHQDLKEEDFDAHQAKQESE